MNPWFAMYLIISFFSWILFFFSLVSILHFHSCILATAMKGGKVKHLALCHNVWHHIQGLLPLSVPNNRAADRHTHLYICKYMVMVINFFFFFYSTSFMHFLLETAPDCRQSTPNPTSQQNANNSYVHPQRKSFQSNSKGSAFVK